MTAYGPIVRCRCLLTRRINVALALGGRFRCLGIADIEKKNCIADGRHEMPGGINLTVYLQPDCAGGWQGREHLPHRQSPRGLAG